MKKSMTLLFVTVLGIHTSHAQEKPMSITEVLKHTPEELAEKLGNRSEAGENYAATLWAAAKRVETDFKLGKTSIQAVQRLDQWRQALNQWEDLKLQAKSIESGGGTMWGHMSARNDAWIEAFLAKHMAALSAEQVANGKAFKSDYLKTINATIDTGVQEFGDDMDHINELAASTKKELQNTHYNLQYLLQTLPECEVKKAVIEMVKPSSD